MFYDNEENNDDNSACQVVNDKFKNTERKKTHAKNLKNNDYQPTNNTCTKDNTTKNMIQSNKHGLKANNSYNE